MPPPGPNGGVADSLDEAKAAFRAAGHTGTAVMDYVSLQEPAANR